MSIKEQIINKYSSKRCIPEKLLDYIIKDEIQAYEDYKIFRSYAQEMGALKDNIKKTKSYKQLEDILPRNIEHYYQFRKEDVEHIEEEDIKDYLKIVNKYEEYIHNDIGMCVHFTGPREIKNEFALKASFYTNAKEENITYLYNLYHFHIKKYLKTDRMDQKEGYEEYIVSLVEAYEEVKTEMMYKCVDKAMSEAKEYNEKSKVKKGGWYGLLYAYYENKKNKKEMTQEEFEIGVEKIRTTTVPAHILIYFLVIKKDVNFTKEEKRDFIRASVYSKNIRKLEMGRSMFNFLV